MMLSGMRWKWGQVNNYEKLRIKWVERLLTFGRRFKCQNKVPRGLIGFNGCGNSSKPFDSYTLLTNTHVHCTYFGCIYSFIFCAHTYSGEYVSQHVPFIFIHLHLTRWLCVSQRDAQFYHRQCSNEFFTQCKKQKKKINKTINQRKIERIKKI